MPKVNQVPDVLRISAVERPVQRGAVKAWHNPTRIF